MSLAAEFPAARGSGLASGRSARRSAGGRGRVSAPPAGGSVERDPSASCSRRPGAGAGPGALVPAHPPHRDAALALSLAGPQFPPSPGEGRFRRRRVGREGEGLRRRRPAAGTPTPGKTARAARSRLGSGGLVRSGSVSAGETEAGPGGDGAAPSTLTLSCGLLSAGARRYPPSARPAPAPCTARWPRRTPTGGRRRPRAPAAGPRASARTWPSGSPWAVAAAGMGTLVTCCPGCRRLRFEPTTSCGPGAPGTTVHLRPPRGRVSGLSRRASFSLHLFGISLSS